MVQELQSQKEQLVVVFIFVVVFLVVVTIGTILFFILSRKKVIQKEREKAELKIAHQQKILQTSISIQEEERKRISQDLHDAISSKLNIVSLSTNMLLSDRQLTQKNKETLSQILDITSTTLESSRRIAHDLLPPVLSKFGLKAALEELFDEFSRNTNISIVYQLEELKIIETNKLHVFRIFQELINNAIRHGKATEMTVFIKYDENGYSMRFQDNGCGFDVSEVNKKAGIGLQNIKSRVKILNGNLIMNSLLNKGSTFLIEVNHGS